MKTLLCIMLLAFAVSLTADIIYVTATDGREFRGEYLAKLDNAIYVQVGDTIYRFHRTAIAKITNGTAPITSLTFRKPDDTFAEFDMAAAVDYGPQPAAVSLTPTITREEACAGLFDGVHIETRMNAPELLPVALLFCMYAWQKFDLAASLQDDIDMFKSLNKSFAEILDIEGDLYDTTIYEDEKKRQLTYAWVYIGLGLVSGVTAAWPVEVYVNERGEVLAGVRVKF
ncbi:MAG: hypothetical protein K8R90_05230 [Candidatus Cloacimonetes bacterium]|nr:hypothetical protein [Candidatus Cloacimonadota bacterium]